MSEPKEPMSEPKEPMTEEARAALASKLDKDLEEFINNLPKRDKPKDSGPMTEEWIEELQSHPFFMKKLPEPGEKVHPLYEGLQKLKYDPDINEPSDLAQAYKEDGNFNFKHKNYRLAYLSYTEGLKANCGDAGLNASLYNNRSACSFFLKNYRTALEDCKRAVDLKPDHKKALYRAAACCLETKRFDECVQFCDKLLFLDRGDSEAVDLKTKGIDGQRRKERDDRKERIRLKKLAIQEAKLVEAIKIRDLNLDGGVDLAKMEPSVPQLMQHRVKLNHDGGLMWPCIVFYPEYLVADYVQQFHEKDLFGQQLVMLFAERPEWDQDGKYLYEDLVVYYETTAGKLREIEMTSRLIDVLSEKDYLIKVGTPTIIVLVKGSPAHLSFLDKYK